MARQTKKKDSQRYVWTGHEEIQDNYTILIPAEHQALREVKSTDARWLYIEISFLRDFETGIAGLNPKISSAMLRQSISHKSDIGIKERKISNNHIQRWIDQLEKAGLIEDRGNHVFYLPLAPKHPRKEKISNSSCNSFSEKCVTVTETVTSSNENGVQPTENKEEKSFYELLQILLQTPILSQQLHLILSHILLPIQYRLDLIRSDLRQKLLDLLAQRKFPLAYLADPRTNAMLDAWEFANITLEEAQKAIQHGDAQATARQERVNRPWYYQDIPFQFRAASDAAKTQTQEINNNAKPIPRAKTKRPFQSVNERVKAALDAIPDDEETIEEGH